MTWCWNIEIWCPAQSISRPVSIYLSWSEGYEYGWVLFISRCWRPRGSTNVENLIVPLANGQPRQAGRFGKTSKWKVVKFHEIPKKRNMPPMNIIPKIWDYMNLISNISCESFGTEVSEDRQGGPGTSTRCDTSLVVGGNNSNTGRQSWHHRPYRPKPKIRRRSDRESEPRHGLQRTATPQQWTLKAALRAVKKSTAHQQQRIITNMVE